MRKRPLQHPKHGRRQLLNVFDNLIVLWQQTLNAVMVDSDAVDLVAKVLRHGYGLSGGFQVVWLTVGDQQDDLAGFR